MYSLEFNLELICTSEFSKKLNLHKPLKSSKNMLRKAILIGILYSRTIEQ